MTKYVISFMYLAFIHLVSGSQLLKPLEFSKARRALKVSCYVNEVTSRKPLVNLQMGAGYQGNQPSN